MNSSPPEAGHRVSLAHARLQPLRHRLQQPVAQAVAERVVDDLEAVEVQEEHAQPLLLAVGLRDGDVQAVVEEQPVGQTGEDVVVGEALDLLFGALPLRDVEGDAEHGRPAPELDGAGGGVQPALLAVPALDLELVARGDRCPLPAGSARAP